MRGGGPLGVGGAGASENVTHVFHPSGRAALSACSGLSHRAFCAFRGAVRQQAPRHPQTLGQGRLHAGNLILMRFDPGFVLRNGARGAHYRA